MLQCDAACGSVLQCVAACCSVLQCVATCCSVLQCVAACCSVLQCVAACCSVLRGRLNSKLTFKTSEKKIYEVKKIHSTCETTKFSEVSSLLNLCSPSFFFQVKKKI